jgi:hypothetical protein
MLAPKPLHLEFTRDGAFALSRDATTVVFQELTGGREVWRWDFPVLGHDGPMAPGPAGGVVALGGVSDLLIIELASGQEVLRFTGLPGWRSCVRFGPRGRKIAYGGMDSSILVFSLDPWNIAHMGKAPPRTDPDRLWRMLADAEAKVGYGAAWAFVHLGAEGESYLVRRLAAGGAGRDAAGAAAGLTTPRAPDADALRRRRAEYALWLIRAEAEAPAAAEDGDAAPGAGPAGASTDAEGGA